MCFCHRLCLARSITHHGNGGAKLALATQKLSLSCFKEGNFHYFHRLLQDLVSSWAFEMLFAAVIVALAWTRHPRWHTRCVVFVVSHQLIQLWGRPNSSMIRSFQGGCPSFRGIRCRGLADDFFSEWEQSFSTGLRRVRGLLQS